MSKLELVLLMAKAIQKIEHNGYHNWESCDECARIRALRQAEECYNIMVESYEKDNS